MKLCPWRRETSLLEAGLGSTQEAAFVQGCFLLENTVSLGPVRSISFDLPISTEF